MTELIQKNKRSLWLEIYRNKQLYFLVLPAILLVLSFCYWPAISGLYHAFFRWDPVEPEVFVGFKHFKTIYHDLFRASTFLSRGIWLWIQLTAWIVPVAGFILFTLAGSIQKKNRDYLNIPVNVLSVVLFIFTFLSLTKCFGNIETSAIKTKAIIYHLIILFAVGFQAFSWFKVKNSNKKTWSRWMALSTVLIIFSGIMLLVSTSEGGTLRAATWNLIRLLSFSLTMGLSMPLLIAEVLFHLKNEKMRYMYRVLFIVPMVVPGIVGILMWQFIYDFEWGIANQLIALMRTTGFKLGFGIFVYFFLLFIVLMKSLSFREIKPGMRTLSGWQIILRVMLVIPAVFLVILIISAIMPSADHRILLTSISSFFSVFDIFKHLPTHGVNWLGDSNIALYSVMFMGFPWLNTVSMLIFYAGLQSIPTSVLECSELDGCSVLGRFWHIELPLITGQIKILLILGVIYGIQEYHKVLILTYGGPGGKTEVPGLRMFKEAFEYGQLGYGTAIGMAMFAIILILTYINMKYIRSSSEYEAE